MTVSDSLPIQFFNVGGGYNDNEPYKIPLNKWNQRWLKTTAINIQCIHNNGADLLLRVVDVDGETYDEFAMTEISAGVYWYSLVPNVEDIQDACIKLQIVEDNGDSTFTIHKESDYIKVQSELNGWVLIRASNNVDDVLGFDFDDLRFIDANTEFYYWVPGIFFFLREVEETENAATSAGNVVQLTGRVKKQMLLQIDFVPDYEHVKLAKLLKMQSVYISSKYWKQEEKYERGEKGSEFNTLSPAEVWLTEQGSITRNVYNSPAQSLVPNSGLFVIVADEGDICTDPATTLYYIGEFGEGTVMYIDDELNELATGNFIKPDAESDYRVIVAGVVGAVDGTCV